MRHIKIYNEETNLISTKEFENKEEAMLFLKNLESLHKEDFIIKSLDSFKDEEDEPILILHSKALNEWLYYFLINY